MPSARPEPPFSGWKSLRMPSNTKSRPGTPNRRRYVGTIGGNIMNSSPAMDTGAPLLVLGAEVELRSKDGSRSVPVSELGRAPAAPPPARVSCS